MIRYGTELIVASIIGILMIQVVSLILHIPVAWFFFLAGFVPLRLTAGGYHASTHFRCYAFFTSMFAFCLVIETKLSGTLQPVLVSLFSSGLILSMSPIEAVNKPLKAQQRKRNRRYSFVILGIVCGTAVLFWRLDMNYTLVHVFYWGVFRQPAPLLLEK